MKREGMQVLPLLLLLACGAQTFDSPNAQAPSGKEPSLIELSDRVAFLDSRQELLFVVDPGNADLKPRMVPLQTNPLTWAKQKGSDHVLVLSTGQAENDQKAAEPGRLVRYDVSSDGPPVILDLPSRFDRFVQTEDGRFVILHHLENSRNQTRLGLYNPNDLALVDWTQPGSVQKRSIRSLGSMPSDVRFAPRTTLFGRERTLAVVFSTNYLTIFEVDAPEGLGKRSEITIPLTPDGKRTVKPKQILFDMQRPAFYVLAEGSNDIFQITLDAVDTITAPGGNDFRASLSMVAAGSSPSDMAFFGNAANRKLLVASPGNQQIAVVDPQTGQSTLLAAPAQVNRVFVFQGKSPKNSTVEDRALLVNQSNGSPMVVFADLSNIERVPSLALESWSAPASISQIILLPRQALLVHSDTGNRTGLSLVNLEERTMAPIGSGGPLTNVLVEEGFHQRLWAISFGNQIQFMNLDSGAGSLAVGEVILDETITAITPLTKASRDSHRYLIVQHFGYSGLGAVTLLDADNPSRKTARSIRGFQLTDYLERGQP